MIKFDKQTHTYTDSETGKLFPSVNEILNAVYGSGVEFVRKDILEAAADRGTAIHAEIENAIKNLKKTPPIFYLETSAFLKWASKNFDLENSTTEQIVSVDSANWYYAGTIDWLCDSILFDYKTSKNKPSKDMLKHWQKQLSFYYHALKMAGKEPKKMIVLHLTGETCTPYELEYLGDKFVEDTLRAYFNGETLKEEKPEATNALESVSQKELLVFADRLKRIKALEEEIAGVKEIIQAEMEKRNILALEVGDVSITYVAPTTRKSFDSTKFKAEHADLYKEYQKESSVKGCIRIKVK